MSSAATDSAITQDDHGAARGCLHPLVMPWLDRVHHGDNCEVLASMPAQSVDLVVTSPPYDDLRTYGGHSWDFYGVAWLLKRVLKPGGVLVWNVADATKDGSETGSSLRQALHFQSIGMNIHDTMIYASDKPPLSHNRYEQKWEYMFVLTKGIPARWNPLKEKSVTAGTMRNRGGGDKGCGDNRNGSNRPGVVTEVQEWKVRGNIWKYDAGKNEKNDHPAPYPDALASDHIQSWSNPCDVVLDPFAGSGTTLRAAKDLNRHYIGIEINEDYLRIINQRLAQDVLALA